MLGRLIRSLLPGRKPPGAAAAPLGDAGAARTLALQAFQQGRTAQAEEAAQRALDGRPGDALLLAVLAWCRFRRGDREGAARHARQALASDGNTTIAHQLLSQLELTGEYYTELLARIHGFLRPRTYVEIGVAQGKSLRLAAPGTRAIGIDPEPKIAEPLGAHITVHAETSDAFFASHDLEAELGGRKLELAFIDGMHLFEFALRDFIHLERHCAPGATILMHDCYPLDEATAARERRTAFWTGDVWRALLALQRHRPELSICTLAVPPSGLAMIRRLDPASAVLRERYAAIVAEFGALPFERIAARKAEALNLVAADWPAVAARLAPGAT